MPSPGLLGIAGPRALIPAPGTGVTAGPRPLPPITTTNGVPDPNAATAAQIAANNQNAAYNNAMTHGNTTTPLGSQTYTSHIDPATGATVYDTNVSLAPDQQKLLDLQNKQSLALGGTANGLLGQIGQNYKDPLKASYTWDDLTKARQSTQDALYARNTQYLDPQFKQDQSALGTRLANQGITLGSDAWNLAMRQFSDSKQKAYGDARDSAISGASGELGLLTNTAHNELVDKMTIRNNPLNEFNALRAASPVNIPQFNPAQTPLSANSDPAGNAYKSSADQIAQQAIRSGNRNSLTSDLFGLGSQVIGSKWGQDLIGKGISKIGNYFSQGGPKTYDMNGLPPDNPSSGGAQSGTPNSQTYGNLGALSATGPAAYAGYQALTSGAAPALHGSITVSELTAAEQAAQDAAAASAASSASVTGASALTEFGSGDLSALSGSGAGAGTGLSTAAGLGIGAAALGGWYGVSRILANQGKKTPMDMYKSLNGAYAIARDKYNQITAGMASGKYSLADRAQAWQQLQQAAQGTASYAMMLGPEKTAEANKIYSEFGQALPDWYRSYLGASSGGTGGGKAY